jgi:predicted nucleic acid-binding protein
MNKEPATIAPDRSAIAGFLDFAETCVTRVCATDGAVWFRRAIGDVGTEADEGRVAATIAIAPRRLGKAELVMTDDELARIDALRPGLDLTGWSMDQLARVAIMLAAYGSEGARFAQALDAFCTTADISELIALYRGFPLYPAPLLLERRAREAVRSGVKPVFEAIAQRNPYPAEVFDEAAWNQMILKALFIESSLWPIVRLDERANPRLARMLVDYARERWAAHRPVSPELWRCVALHADEDEIEAMARAIASGDEGERLAIALAFKREARRAPLPFDKELVALRDRIDMERLDWRSLA